MSEKNGGVKRQRTSSSLFIDNGRLDATHDEREEGERKVVR